MRTSGFISNVRGNVAIIFALALFPLLLAVGAAIDWARVNQVKNALQRAADFSVLAAGASSQTDDVEVEKIAKNYLAEANLSEVVQSIKSSNVKSKSKDGTVSVKLEGIMKTSFMSLAGIPTITVAVEAEVARAGASAPLEMALALDTTGSMMGQKIADLRTAANSLVDKVLVPDAPTKIAVVPFNEYVNVGTDKEGSPWLRVTHPMTYWSSFDYPNKTGCTIVNTVGTCTNDGVSYSCPSSYETCTDMGAPVETKHETPEPWYGCVGSREGSRAEDIRRPTVDQYPGINNAWCGSIMSDLTSDKATVSSTINSISANGNTYIPAGLMWGWNVLDPAVPYNTAQSYADISAAKGKKVLVLMTDGANTLKQTTYGKHEACAEPCEPANTLTSKLCENIKAQGIVIYTVLFDVNDADMEKMLKDCATEPSKSFVASNGAALLDAFNSIGKSLTELRLTK